MKKNLLIFVLFLCFNLSVSAQYHHSYNDNWRYFYDIGVEGGWFSSMNNVSLSSERTFTVTGSYFFNHRFGFRSGVSFINGLAGGADYWRIPLLFAFRTRTVIGEYFDPRPHSPFYTPPEEMRSNLGVFILSLLPTRFELNAGMSFGGISPFNTKTYWSSDGHNFVHSETIDISRRFAASLDANARVSFQFWRICVNGNFGISYLLTRNIRHYTINPNTGDNRTNPSWFGNVGVGVSFRF
jgi:hypothetical protein